MYSNNDPLQGRKLAEDWDVNPPRLLEEHYANTNGKIRTRFPPEPNGYAHFGHGKSCYMNFKEAFDKLASSRNDNTPIERHVTFRYDDTNPEAESQEFIDSIAASVKWLGWAPDRTTYTSDYFHDLYDLAEQLIIKGLAFVCHQTGDEIEASRKIVRSMHAGTNVGNQVPESPYRNQSVEENLKKFRAMKRGMYSESEASLRMKIDMRHQNPNLWDPVAYRIMYHPHPRTGSTWCIYPTYDFSHCIVDSLEDIDYSICTLEFENRRESYYWLLYALDMYRPKVFEMARLAVTRTMMSKRKLKKLVDTKQVRGWDDPRMPTLMGMRRRGFTKEMINSFMEEIGITRSMSIIPMERFLGVVGKILDETSPRVFGVVNPVPLTLTNIPSQFSCSFEAPLFPQRKETSITPPPGGNTTSYSEEEKRILQFSRHVFVDRDNVRVVGDASFYGFFPGQIVRLRYGPLVLCNKVDCDSTGTIIGLEGVAWVNGAGLEAEQQAGPVPSIKPKGIVHWLSSKPGERPMKAELRLYDHLMPENDDDEENEISPTSEIVVRNAMIEPIVSQLIGPTMGKDNMVHMQFERVGYFVSDCMDSTPSNLVLNRTIGLQTFVVEDINKSKLQSSGPSRSELVKAQTAAKQERLKYSPIELFKRPGEVEKYSAWDEDGVPTQMVGETEPMSKAARKKLRKDWEKHKEEWTALQAKLGTTL